MVQPVSETCVSFHCWEVSERLTAHCTTFAPESLEAACTATQLWSPLALVSR